MARDPNNLYDREKERNALTRAVRDVDGNVLPTYENGVLINPQAQVSTPVAQRVGRTLRREASGLVDDLTMPLARAAAEAQGTYQQYPTADRAAAAVPQVRFQDPEDLLATRQDVLGATNPDGGRSAASGLTRIVKTADGTYVQTSDPNVRGEARIYDALGNRADRPADAGFEQGRPRATSVQEAFRRQQGATDLMDTASGREQVLRNGATSLERIGRMRAEATTAAQKAVLDSMSPKDRATMLQEAQKEAGLDRRHAQTLQVQREGQAAAQMNARTANAKAQLDQENLERTKYEADPQAYMRNTLAELGNMTPAQQTEWLSGSSPRAALARSAFASLAREGGINDPAQITEASGFRRFLQRPWSLGLTAPKFDTNNGILIDDLINPEDYQLSEEQLRTLINASAQVNSRR